MRRSRPLLVVLSLALLASAAGASSRLEIREVFFLLDATPPQVVILGRSFDRGTGPLVVLLGEFPDPLVVVSHTATAIQAELPPGVAPGDYSLSVANGNRSKYRDVFDATVQGGPAGQTCPPGESVVGFDAAGDILCAGEPEPEVCDGEDNDLDGSIDEGVTNACGECGEVGEEVCDGEDNDCDGGIDEGVTNACGGCGEVGEEVCDGEDNDCDGGIDEGVTNACGGCGAVPIDVCNGVDDDCDGGIDEGACVIGP